MEYFSSLGRTKVFISYSHKDKYYLERLTVHLAQMQREGLIEIWDDTKIIPGAEWRKEIERSIALARVAVVLISADFLATNFIAEHVLPALLRNAQVGGATILPVIVSPCEFEHTELAQFQAVNDPSQALTKMSTHEQEETWYEVAKTIRQLLAQQEAGKSVRMRGEYTRRMTVQEYPEAELTGASLEQLVKALMDAYPTPADLRLLVAYKLNENLHTIAGEGNFETITHSLVDWARSHGRMKELVVGALERNPGNGKLRRFAAENGFTQLRL